MNQRKNLIIILDYYIMLIGGENHAGRVKIVPFPGSPRCSGSPPQITGDVTGTGKVHRTVVYANP